MIRALLALALASAPLTTAAQAVTPRPEITPATAPPPPVLPAPAPPARPAPPPNSLTGQSEVQVRARLGQPPVARREAGGALWTYATDACALMVFFRVQGREGLRVSGASAGPRRRGQPNPDTEACITATALAKS